MYPPKIHEFQFCQPIGVNFYPIFQFPFEIVMPKMNLFELGVKSIT
jgi:hypothetical protein